jgi:precorrin-2 dehydrogenase/sirohydrochlorin ferrochelatase
VAGEAVAISGDNAEAAEKAHRLLHAGAKVTLYTPAPDDERLNELIRAQSVSHIERWLEPHEVPAFRLVLSTRIDSAYNDALARACREAKVLVNCYDVPGLSDFSMPAVVQRGRLQMAIFTGGASPTLARKIRQSLERLFDDAFVRFLDSLGALRERTKREESDPARRRETLISAVEGFEIEGTIKYPKSDAPRGGN